MVWGYLGLGSNLGSFAGDPCRTLLRAAAACAALPGVRGGRLSSVYRTAPVGPPQPDYANAVLALEVAVDARELLLGTRAIEARFGRVRRRPLEPRSLDIDLLVVGDQRAGDADLILPHPRLHLRRFVLVPLAELEPQLVLPGLGETVATLLLRCPDRSRVEPWIPPAVASAVTPESRAVVARA